MKKCCRWLCALAAMGSGLLWPLISRADEPPVNPVIICEVNWAGSSKSLADEWVELANISSERVSIGGWSIVGAAAEPLAIPTDTFLEPHTTFLISNYDKLNEKSSLAVHSNLVTTAVSLSNSSLKIILQTEVGVVVDMAGNNEKPLAGTTSSVTEATSRSMIRRFPLLAGDLGEAWSTAETSEGFDVGSPEKGTPGTCAELLALSDPPPTEPSATPEETLPVTLPIEVPNDAVPESIVSDTPLETTVTAQEILSPEVTTATAIPPTPAPLVTYPTGTILLNEIVPNPTEGEEWVEIYNPYNNVIPLKGWRVRDASGRFVPLPEQLLGLEQFVVVGRASGWLNNQSETVELIDPTGVVVDRMEYTENDHLEKDMGLIRTSTFSLALTTTLTPHSANIETPPSKPVVRDPSSTQSTAPITEPPPPKVQTAEITPLVLNGIHESVPARLENVVLPAKNITTISSKPKQVAKKTTSASRTLSISALKNLRAGTKVVSEGVITADTKTFGPQIIYIESEGESIQVFRQNGRFNGLEVGQRIRVEGAVGSSEGEKRIRITESAAVQVMNGGNTVEPHDIELSTLDERALGMLVRIRAVAAYAMGKKLMVESTESGVWIVPPERLTLPPETILPGVSLEVTGIVRTYNGELRVVPRSLEDIRVIAPPATEMNAPTGKERERGKQEHTAITLTAAGLLTLAGLAIKHFLLS